MLGLIIFILIISFGIYYVTTLDFEVGSGISEEKSQAKEVKYTIHKQEVAKKILEKNIEVEVDKRIAK